MKLWFERNGVKRYIESNSDSELIEEMENSFRKGFKLDSAGCYVTEHFVSLYLSATNFLSDDFKQYIIDSLRQTKMDCLAAEHKLDEIRGKHG